MCFFVLVELDFESVANLVLVFNASQQEINVLINVLNDSEIEDPEEFTASLVLLSNNVNAEVNPSQANVRIISDDRKLLLLSWFIDIHLFPFLSFFCLSVCLSFFVSLFLCLSLSVCLSVLLSLSNFLSLSLSLYSLCFFVAVVLGFDRQTYLTSETQGWVLLRVSVTVGVPMDGIEMQLQTFPLSAQRGCDSTVMQTQC